MAHFNLAVLEDQKDTDKSPDAQKSTDTTQDAEPSASRYLVVTLKIVLQGGHTPQEQLPLPADVNTDLSMRYQQVTSLITLGRIFLILMSIHTHTT